MSRGAPEPAAPASRPPIPRPVFVRRWAIFVAERFPLPRHLAMVGAFFAGNAAVAGAVTGASIMTPRSAAAAGVVLLVFLRLRIFDEIKDSRTDRDLHPERPLARGLIGVAEARRVAAGIALVEGLLALICGIGAFAAWLAVLGFSLLMYREFFVGEWLRPRMELYAVSHTLVAAGIGLFVAATVAGAMPWRLPVDIGGFALANWMVFNVFEFARKTYGGQEESSAIDSYSRRLGPRGAALMSLAMVVAAIAATRSALLDTPPARYLAVALSGLALLVLVTSVPYLLAPGQSAARLFRGSMQLFLVAFYAVVAVLLIWSGVR